jgi:hypothetical protein
MMFDSPVTIIAILLVAIDVPLLILIALDRSGKFRIFGRNAGEKRRIERRAQRSES